MNKEYTPEYVYSIAVDIQKYLQKSIFEINDVHNKAHVLSINARIEAARSGHHGAGFKIVAQEFSNLNNEISSISSTLGDNINNKSKKLMLVSDGMAKQVRGQRLSQIALSIMDVIDRNLYERTCDVRWWATDPSISEALISNDNTKIDFASKRLGEILDSYTVYLDLICANISGKIICNGRPLHYNSVNSSVSNNKWFTNSKLSNDKNEYSFEGMHSSELVNNEDVLIYGCNIYNKNNPVGVLGILFNWKGLVEAVMNRVLRIDLKNDIEVLKLETSIKIINEEGIILASSLNRNVGNKFDSENINNILQSKSTGHFITEKESNIKLIAYGYSPGFETYKTGWFCIIEQILR